MIPSDARRMTPAPQLPLALRYPPDQRLDTFVAAPAGAVAQLHALATRAGSEWVYLAGPAGVGKTHLALAACAAAEDAGRRAAYVPLKTAAGRMRDALDAFDDHALVALDGLDAIAGNREDEVALFDFHNRARASGAGVLYTATVSPDALALTLPDLRSRLSQCARVLLSPLDDAGRRDVLRERAQRRGLALDDAAIDWLLRRRGRDLATLTGLLDVLDRASLAAQRRITVPFLREALGEK
jgi:DnaA-homolog protein